MIIQEPRRFAWLYLRRRRTMAIGETTLTLSGQAINHFAILGVSQSAAWFLPAWLGGRQVRINFADGKQRWIYPHANYGHRVDDIQHAIVGAVTTYLSRIVADLAAKVGALEDRRLALYRPDRFVRHSQAHGFAEREQASYERWRRNGEALRCHPLLPEAQKRRVAESLARLVGIAPSVEDAEQTRKLHNDTYAAVFRQAEADYFRAVESSPLTDEQIDAALVFEDATLVVAAAGSGKSSCIVGKIGFALKTGMFQDHEILALAYNRDAAKSLQVRLNDKLGKALGRKVSVASKTFHSFGLSTLCRRHGPDYEPKVLKEDEGEEGRLLRSVIGDLAREDPAFQSALVEWLSVSPYEDPQLVGGGDPEECAKRYEECCRERIHARSDPARKSFDPSIPTFDVSIYVRSLEERSIANWLILRGVVFKYEAPDYEGGRRLGLGKTKNGKQKPYKPDFTYAFDETLPNGRTRKVRVVHEHFALNIDGQAPAWMGGAKYAAQAAGKRRMFAQWIGEGSQGERLVFFETHSHQSRDGSIWPHLETCLRQAGIGIGLLSEAIRTAALASFGEASDLEQLLVDFVLRFKESGLTAPQVEREAQRSPNPYRAKLFLAVAFKVFAAYQSKLRSVGKIDFADMLRDAIDVLHADRDTVPYRLVLVDEFQDISRLKADLVKAVLDQVPDSSMVFCVGDDWQTINRFAGSDVGIFTDAAGYFKRHTETLKLTRTFRCAQGIADVSRALVMTNPNQFDKKVKALTPSIAHGVRVLLHGPLADHRRAALTSELTRIADAAQAIGLACPSVLVLRRTKKPTTTPDGLDEAFLTGVTRQFRRHLDIRLLTVHGSKGLEADFVILPGLDSGRRGFPDERPPEPLLDLVLPELQDLVEEERRLFYVGLTRARHQAIVLANAERPSEFVLQLEALRPHFETIEWTPSNIQRSPCPNCGIGSLYLPNEKLSAPICSRQVSCGYREGRRR